MDLWPRRSLSLLVVFQYLFLVPLILKQHLHFWGVHWSRHRFSIWVTILLNFVCSWIKWIWLNVWKIGSCRYAGQYNEGQSMSSEVLMGKEGKYTIYNVGFLQPWTPWMRINKSEREIDYLEPLVFQILLTDNLMQWPLL